MNIKTKKEIKIMAKGGKKLRTALNFLISHLKSGIKTKDLELLARQKIRQLQGRPSFLGYRGYPSAICVSLNSEVVHGLPSERIIKNGDLASLDLGFEYRGFHTDSAVTIAIGKISPQYKKLLNTCQKALDLAIFQVKPGNFTGDIGFIIKKTIEEAGFQVITDLSGHGIGKEIHEQPSIPNFGKPGQGIKLVPGMTFAIEPMATIFSPKLKTQPDHWTIVTQDEGISAHFEKTVAVTENSHLVLT